MEKEPLLGAHMSIQNGLEQAIKRGESIGCTAIQIFTRSNRQWRARPITQTEALLFQQTQQTSTVKCIVVHAPYLINIGSPNQHTHAQSQKTLLEELNRCDMLNIPYLILHPGSRLHEDEETCIQRIATTINSIFETYKGKTTLLLENAAGQGSSVGYTLEQLSSMLHLVKDQHAVGICFDSCHAHAAGYDLKTPHLYHTFWKTFDNLIGIKKLKVIHLSNSKKTCGSRVDRHEFIDKGTMSSTTFSLIMNDPRFVSIPKILETPAIELSDYAKDMTYLKKLLS